MENMRTLHTIIDRDKPTMIITVGDTVSRNLHEYGMAPQLSIIDNKSMRKPIDRVKLGTGKIVHAKNPPGTITDEAVKAVREALSSQEEVHLVVEGEEDLLALIAVLYAPEKSFVIYGQPHEGIVIVETTAEKKAEASKILEAMTVRKPK